MGIYHIVIDSKKRKNEKEGITRPSGKRKTVQTLGEGTYGVEVGFETKRGEETEFGFKTAFPRLSWKGKGGESQKKVIHLNLIGTCHAIVW